MLLTAIRSGSLIQTIACLLASVFVIFCVLPIHECAHAYVATKFGDNTAKFRGRLTLNPMAHIDVIGAIMIALVGFGWAKPVPIDERNFKNKKLGVAMTSLAGPLSNILVAILLLLIMQTTIYCTDDYMSNLVLAIYKFLSYAAQINVMLAVFNLLPIPPLDGYRILSVFLPRDVYYKMLQYERYISIVVIVLIFSGALTRPVDYLYMWLFDALIKLTGLPFGLS